MGDLDEPNKRCAAETPLQSREVIPQVHVSELRERAGATDAEHEDDEVDQVLHQEVESDQYATAQGTEHQGKPSVDLNHLLGRLRRNRGAKPEIRRGEEGPCDEERGRQANHQELGGVVDQRGGRVDCECQAQRSVLAHAVALGVGVRGREPIADGIRNPEDEKAEVLRVNRRVFGCHVHRGVGTDDHDPLGTRCLGKDGFLLEAAVLCPNDCHEVLQWCRRIL
mmetsp:Transcript_28033/g.70371  ORF Transcript_28033/g.70371 Transcript_28033/m.70371 type:complete len:224 (-) Transcript_28033:242-913(-)